MTNIHHLGRDQILRFAVGHYVVNLDNSGKGGVNQGILGLNPKLKISLLCWGTPNGSAQTE